MTTPSRRFGDFAEPTTIDKLQRYVGNISSTAHFDASGRRRETEYRWPCGCRASSTNQRATIWYKPCEQHDRRARTR